MPTTSVFGDMPSVQRAQGQGNAKHETELILCRLVDLSAGDCSALERLAADSNQLTALPDSLARLRNLAVISAAHNRCARQRHCGIPCAHP